jgi:hypothetical protein
MLTPSFQLLQQNLIPEGGYGCSKAIHHAPSWLNAFGTPGPPLRGRGQIGPLGLLVGVFPIGIFSLSPDQEWLTVADSSMDK